MPRRYALLSVLKARVLDFHSIKALYIEDQDFKKVIEDPSLWLIHLKRGFLFKGNKLYIPKSTLRDLIVKEAHEEP